MTALNELSLDDARKFVNNGDVTSLELVQACLKQIDKHDDRLNTFIRLESELAQTQAEEFDKNRKRQSEIGLLGGVPLAHKDMYYRAGLSTTCGSKIRRDYKSTTTSTAIERLAESGALNLGGLNMAEFAFSPTGHNTHFGACRNPWNTDYVTGGSSSGSGSAVAARMAFGSLGSDTGGSIRLPAGFCGLVGIKPTQTRVSRYGVMGLSFSLDNVGPLTRTVKDNALILSVIAGHDPKDATSSTQPVGNYLEAVDNPSAKGFKIGIARGYFEDGADDTIIESRDAAVKSFTEQGAAIVEIDCGDINHINSLAAFIAGTEAATLHAYWLRHRRDDYGPQVLARIESGLQFSGVDYLHAIQLRPKIITEFVKKAFADCDIILAPTFNIETPRIDETDVEDGQGFEALMSTVSHCTRPFNYLTLPSLSLPTPELANKMPASIQLIAPPFHEKLLYRVGSAYEKHTSFSQRAPNL
jgi:aspartyl-tRNA(Asn)/glutamyl-tRNA(Gln) amidotransferase subunit A